MFLEETAELYVWCLCGLRLPLDKYTEEHKEADNFVHVAHLKKSSALFMLKWREDDCKGKTNSVFVTLADDYAASKPASDDREQHQNCLSCTY